MNILVTGADGQLGRSLRVSSARSSDHYLFTDVDRLDVTDAQAVMDAIVSNKIDVIINCAAYTNVDKAEDDAVAADRLNSYAVSLLAAAAKSVGGWLIHISTDYVFGGNDGNTPRTESEATNPTGVYGLTKLHGEQAVIQSGVKNLIIRTSWLYSEYGRNFVKTMLDLTAAKSHLKVVFDQCGTPTYAGDLADAIVRIVDSRLFEGNEGIYHFSNEGVCSWYDFAVRISRLAGGRNCRIEPCHSDEFPSKVVRPAYSVLDKTKFKTTFGIEIPYWEDSLNKCINNLKKL